MPRRIDIEIELEVDDRLLSSCHSKTPEVMTAVATKAAIEMHTLLEGHEPKVVSKSHTEYYLGEDEEERGL